VFCFFRAPLSALRFFCACQSHNGTLPAEVPVHPAVQVFTIPATDPRAALRGQARPLLRHTAHTHPGFSCARIVSSRIVAP
jgi:hypothetical protein